jgi:hypothetical protein
MKLGRLGFMIARGFRLERVFSVARVAGLQYHPVWQFHQGGGSCWATCRPTNVVGGFSRWRFQSLAVTVVGGDSRWQ